MIKPTDAFVAEKPTDEDLETVAAQLGRAPRDVSAVAHRCPCGQVDVVQTPPRLVAHSLAAGVGVNPLGDEALSALEPWWLNKPCSQISNLLDEAE
jgi:hypothetical protein